MPGLLCHRAQARLFNRFHESGPHGNPFFEVARIAGNALNNLQLAAWVPYVVRDPGHSQFTGRDGAPANSARDLPPRTTLVGKGRSAWASAPARWPVRSTRALSYAGLRWIVSRRSVYRQLVEDTSRPVGG
jgi:hypothetical protein